MPYKDYNKLLEHARKYSKEYHQKHKKEHKKYYKKYSKEYYKTHIEKRRMYKYGISNTDFNNLLFAQNNRCAICKEPLDLQTPYAVHIDHDHKRGKVRGILCRKCNLAIGQLRDNPEYAYNAFIYLKESD